ncbi:MAG: Hpt domain-containing protein [Ruminococcus sp.]|nr:Hpt domain-containing protein [Ruminococcus sp.]
MTLRELYSEIGGDYDQALRVLRVEKLIDKHIRKLTSNGVVEGLVDAAKRMAHSEMFDAAHAMKGVCANLGLTALSELASEIAEKYRPGNPRKLSDEEVSARVARIEQIYTTPADGIKEVRRELILLRF